jgi:hypothetical protein
MCGRALMFIMDCTNADWRALWYFSLETPIKESNFSNFDNESKYTETDILVSKNTLGQNNISKVHSQSCKKSY